MATDPFDLLPTELWHAVLDRVLGDCDEAGLASAGAFLSTCRRAAELKGPWLAAAHRRLHFAGIPDDAQDIPHDMCTWAHASAVLEYTIRGHRGLRRLMRKRGVPCGLEVYPVAHGNFWLGLMDQMRPTLALLMHTNPVMTDQLCGRLGFDKLMDASVWIAYASYIPRTPAAPPLRWGHGQILQLWGWLTRGVEPGTPTMECQMRILGRVCTDMAFKMRHKFIHDDLAFLLALMTSVSLDADLGDTMGAALNIVLCYMEVGYERITRAFGVYMCDTAAAVLATERGGLSCCVQRPFVAWGVHSDGLNVGALARVLAAMPYTSTEEMFRDLMRAFWRDRDVLAEEELSVCTENITKLISLNDGSWAWRSWADILDGDAVEALFPTHPTQSEVLLQPGCDDDDDWAVATAVLDSGDAHMIALPRKSGEAHSALLHNSVVACLAHRNAGMLALPTLQKARRVQFFQRHVLWWRDHSAAVITALHARGLVFGAYEHRLLADAAPALAAQLAHLFEK